MRAVPLGKGCQNGAKCVWMEEGVRMADMAVQALLRGRQMDKGRYVGAFF